MTATLRFRDIIKAPRWLSDRGENGLSDGFRYLWTLVAPLDAAAEVLLQGLCARLPGFGHASALPYIGRSRLLIRGQNESDEAFAARLIAWLDVHPEAGWDERIARIVHEYLEAHPMVRVVDRSGQWTTIAEDGTVTRANAAFPWDTVSHPERNDPDAPYWSDLWVIVYPTPFAQRPGTLGGLLGDDDYSIGHMVPRRDVDALRALFAQWKGAHARIRAVIWTTDATKFDPDDPGSMPDGTWGAWSINSGGSQVKSGRDLTTCRFWEPW